MDIYIDIYIMHIYYLDIYSIFMSTYGYLNKSKYGYVLLENG